MKEEIIGAVQRKAFRSRIGTHFPLGSKIIWRKKKLRGKRIAIVVKTANSIGHSRELVTHDELYSIEKTGAITIYHKLNPRCR